MKTIKIIPSKSYAHRAYICQALSTNQGEIICEETSEDIDATKTCLAALISGQDCLPCNESGSTLRFLLPVAGALGKNVFFERKGRLGERPLSPLKEQLEAHGCRLSEEEKSCIEISGQLTGGDFSLPGDVSSQFISGLMFALPLLDKDSHVTITNSLESKGYVDITVNVLKDFGIDITTEKSGYFIWGNQKYKCPLSYKIEGDWSNASFWLAAGGLLREGLICKGLNLNSLQGDRQIVKILQDFGANVNCLDDKVQVTREQLLSVKLDVSAIPDLVPVISLIASVAKGKSYIQNAGRLRLKESDRLKSVAETLNKLGGNITEKEDGLIIQGVESLNGGTVDSYGDHRIVMMAAIASLVCKEKVIIKNSKAVNKSYPRFFSDLHSLDLDSNIEIE